MERLLRAGDKLYLTFKNENGEEEIYKTVIAQKKDHLYVETPINEKTKKFGHFPTGARFFATFVNNKKVYGFETELLGRRTENVPLLILSYPGDAALKNIQRREHVRVPAMLDVAVHPCGTPFKPFTTTTMDISGGGCSLNLPEENALKEGMDVYLWLALPMKSGRYHYFKIKSRLVRLVSDGTRIRASFEFTDLNEFKRMQIIRYCFQRDLYLKRMVKG
jgi:c-di-GMP-binding flagellar brake protein YcgR